MVNFNEYPYRNLTDLNLDYLEKKMNILQEIMDTFVTLNTVTFADPIIWNITTQYARNTVVLDTAGNAYLSKEAVPAGVQLNNSDFWLEIFNFTEYTRTANQNLTINVETNTTRATHAYNVDDWLIWNDVLYKVTSAIAIDDTLMIGTNIVHFTVEDFIKAFMTWATNTIQQYKNDIDASELQYRQQLAGDIANTTASLQAQLDAVIAGATVDSEVIDARISWDNVTYTTLGTAIRTQCFDIVKQIEKYNSYDEWLRILKTQHPVLPTTATASGVAFIFNADGTISLNGNAGSSGAFRDIFSASNSLPTGIEAGKTYQLHISGTTSNSALRIYWYRSGVIQPVQGYKTDSLITAPNDATGMIIRAYVDGSTSINTTFTISFLTHMSNDDLKTYVDNINSNLSDSIDWLESMLEKYNSTDVWYKLLTTQHPNLPSSQTHSGVTYVFNADGTISVNGYASSESFRTIFESESSLPNGIIAGESYNLKAENMPIGCAFRIYWHQSGAWTSSTSYYDGDVINVPSNADGMRMRILVDGGTTIATTITVKLFTNLTVNDVISMFETTLINENFSFINAPNSTRGENVGKEITVMSYNVAMYNNDTPDYISDEKVLNFRKMLSKVNADFIGVQEDRPYIDANDTLDSKDYLYYPIYPEKAGSGGVAIHSKQKVTGNGMVKYSNDRNLRWATYSINGKVLLFISTHPIYGTSAADIAARAIQYNELFKWIYREITLNDYSTSNPVTCPVWDYCIITGDFNSNSATDRANLTNEATARGFSMANGGYLGWLKTCNLQLKTATPLDNVLVSPNVIINSIETLTGWYNDLYSDHIPIIAKVTLL